MDTNETTDVKETVESSTTTTAKDSVDTTKKEESIETPFEELIEKKTVPYGVFKERNEKLRETERKLKQMERDLEVKVQEAVSKTASQYDVYYKQQLMQQQQPKEEINPYDYSDESVTLRKQYDSVINSLKGEVESLKSSFSRAKEETDNERLGRTVTNLKSAYPMMDEEHVLAVKKLNPSMDLDEIAKYSHDKFSAKTKAMYESMIESKKQAAKKAVMGSEGRAAFKPENATKNMKDAKKLSLEYLKQFDKSKE